MESAEHALIGDRINLQFDSGSQPAGAVPLILPLDAAQSAPRSLTYGQLVALAGDFYGVVGNPISTSNDPTATFKAAFQSLGDDWGQTQQILAVMGEEITAVKRAVSEGKEASTAYALLGDSLSLKWNEITGGYNLGGLPVVMGRYLNLAAENWDHFTGYAVAAYRAGHAIAMELAAAIPGANVSPEEKQARFQAAYAINAFADHFLTDLFSAGHIRVPRRELYDQVATPIPGFSGTLGSLLSRCMHDEDCKNGLKVHNAAGNSWTAYGDKRLLDGVSKDNFEMAVRATQASANDVWDAYRGGAFAYSALQLTPDLVKVADVTSKENYSPLFLAQNGKADRRNDVHNRQDYSWTSDWWGWSTYAQIMETTYTTVKCYRLDNGQFIGWLGVGGNNYTYVVADEKNAHRVAWYVYGEELYLCKETSGGSARYLGEGWDSYADWGLWGGNFKSPVMYNADQTITLKPAPTRKLYLATDNQLRWSNGETNVTFVRVELPLGR